MSGAGTGAGGESVHLNGRLVPREGACVSIHDRGFLYGDGVFETLRVYEGVPFMFGAHIARLEDSARAIGLALPFDAPWLRAAAYETLGANGHREAVLRIAVSRGVGRPGLSTLGCGRPTVLIESRPFGGHPASLYASGLTVHVARTRRMPTSALDPAAKTANFLNAILARQEADSRGADEALMLNTRGRLAECTVGNVFFVATDGGLHTPGLSEGILPGITRRVILGLARAMGLNVHEQSYTPRDIRAAREAFVTSSTYEAMPIARLGGRAYSDWPVTRALGEAYAGEVRAYVEGHERPDSRTDEGG